MKSKLSALEINTFKAILAEFCFLPLQVLVGCSGVLFGFYCCIGYPEVDSNIERFLFLDGCAFASALFLLVCVVLYVYYSLAKPADDINSKTERKENEK